jgi:hypothetical protein
MNHDVGLFGHLSKFTELVTASNVVTTNDQQPSQSEKKSPSSTQSTIQMHYFDSYHIRPESQPFTVQPMQVEHYACLLVWVINTKTDAPMIN